MRYVIIIAALTLPIIAWYESRARKKRSILRSGYRKRASALRARFADYEERVSGIRGEALNYVTSLDRTASGALLRVQALLYNFKGHLDSIDSCIESGQYVRANSLLRPPEKLLGDTDSGTPPGKQDCGSWGRWEHELDAALEILQAAVRTSRSHRIALEGLARNRRA